jgi:hypothetical protein
MNSILNVQVSCFAGYDKPGNPKPVNLLKWLNSAKYQKTVNEIRKLTDSDERKKLKKDLPAITPSGIFSYHKEEAFISHSGLIQFDIDLQHNTYISNWSELKEQIFKIRNVAYIGLSVSGQGYWGLIPISDPAQHKGHFKAIQKAFRARGITLDSAPANVSALRGYSYDPEAYFRHDAKVFTGILKDEPRPATITRKAGIKRTDSNIENILRDMIRNSVDGEKHIKLRNASFLAGGYVAGGQLDEQQAIDLLTDEIQAKPNVKDLQAAIKTINSGIKNGMLKPIYPDAITYTPAPPTKRPPTPAEPTPHRAVQPPTETRQPEPEPLYITPDPIPAVTWQADINELEQYFSGITTPAHPLTLNDHSTITNLSQFIESHLQTVKANDGKECFRPYLNRLQEIKQIISHVAF